MGLGAFGNHIGARAARNDARIHGDAAPQIGERGDALDLPRQFHDRARALFEIDARVGSHSTHGKPVVADSFARGLQLPGKRRARFQNEHALALFCIALGERARGLAAGLLIRVDLQNDVTPDGEVQFAKRPHGEDKHREAGLHIENAGTPKTALGAAERHCLQCPERPDGIGMAQGEDLGLFCARAGQAEFTQQMGLFCLAARLPLDRVGEEFIESPQVGGRVAGRFAFHQLANEVDDRRLPLAGPGEKRVR